MKWKSIFGASISLLCALASCNRGTESQPLASSTDIPTAEYSTASPTAEYPTATPTSTLSPTPPTPLSYTAILQFPEEKISGVICSLALPFALDVTFTDADMSYQIEFTPASSTSGTWKYEWQEGEGVISLTGSGIYTVSGSETDSPRIVMSGSQTSTAPVVGSSTGSVDWTINLTELAANECN
jgi:hypothetical protein